METDPARDPAFIAGSAWQASASPRLRALDVRPRPSRTLHWRGNEEEQQPGHRRKTAAKPKSKTPKFERVLVVSAHPDDPEFSAGGSIAKLAKDGAEVTYVIVTDGSQGGEDPNQKDSDLAAIRQKEQRAAARVLGVKKVEFLGYKDGHLTHDLKLRRDIVRMIRKYKPDAGHHASSRTRCSTPRWAARTLTTSRWARPRLPPSIPTRATLARSAASSRRVTRRSSSRRSGCRTGPRATSSSTSARRST